MITLESLLMLRAALTGVPGLILIECGIIYFWRRYSQRQNPLQPDKMELVALGIVALGYILVVKGIGIFPPPNYTYPSRLLVREFTLIIIILSLSLNSPWFKGNEAQGKSKEEKTNSKWKIRF